VSENEFLVVVIALLACSLFLTWYFRYRRVLLRKLTDRAEVVLDQDFSSFGGENAKRKAAFLARHGRVAEKRYKYYESIIAIGETVAVLGAGTREPDPDAKPRGDDVPATRLLLTTSDKNKLVISDVRKTMC
jgi:hypothetical protein